MRLLVAIVLCGTLGACATSSRDKPATERGPKAGIDLVDRLTLTVDSTTLGAFVRRVGQVTGGRIALMNGIEHIRLEQLKFKEAGFAEVARVLAQKSQCSVQECPNYYFLLPREGYETLEEVSVAGVLGDSFRKEVDRLAFGAGVPLYAVFAWIGQGLQVTVVGDNAVSAARCGEVALRQLPIDEALEAILKSARVAEVQIDETEEYVFFQARGNESSRSSLLNERDLTDEERTFLERRVTVNLPHPSLNPGQIEIVADAQPLAEVLLPLSEQLGIRVIAEKGLEELPVNPAAFVAVRVRTAMDLLVRQWLVPEFGYELRADRILIRRRTAEERAP